MRAILAVNKLGFIGLGNKLPWKCPDDLKHFKEMTYKSTCLVGRKTYDSLPFLKDRKLIVVGRGEKYYYKSIDEAIEKTDPDWVIGGKSIFEQTLHLCSELHISIVNDYSIGDVSCPDLNCFDGQIFIYNFESVPKFKKTLATDIISNEIMPSLQKRIGLNEKWYEYLEGLDKYPQMNTVCRYEILEQQLINQGLTPEQAAKYPKYITCNCVKCKSKNLLT